jgi:hypothetical protein
MQIFYAEASLEEGFEIGQQPKHSRLLKGREVSLASGFALFQSLRGHTIKCYNCGCVADRWISSKGPSDLKSKPVLNLFATRHHPKTKKRAAWFELVLMTRDHIIPKSYGGSDSVKNLRPACDTCNGQRGHQMTEADLAFMAKHPELISAERLRARAEAKQRKLEKKHA